MKRSLLLLLVLGLVICASAAEPKDDNPPPAKTSPPSDRAIREWIQQLGDASFTVRETATKTLIQAGPHAITAVREAAKSADPEVSKRALHIAEQIERQSIATLEALGAMVNLNSTDGSVESLEFGRDKPGPLTDADLIHLWPLRDLAGLSLQRTAVTDAGLVHLGRLSKLKRLSLSGTGITDNGLAHLSAMTTLESLVLDDTRVTGFGLAHLKTLKNLADLSLDGTPITSAGLADGVAGLKDLKNLAYLGVERTDIDAACLAEIKKLQSLMRLSLAHSPVTDKALAHLKALPDLSALSLHSTAVTDAGCTHLAAMKELVALSLWNTRVTSTGLKKLEDLPRLKSLAIAGQHQMTVKQALELLARIAPPEFAVIREFDKTTGIVLYEVGYPGVIKEEAVVPGKDGKKTIEFYRPITQTVSVRYSVKDGPVYDAEGKKLSSDEALKRVSVGTVVLLSTDGKTVHADYLKALNKDTLILIPPVQQPSPEKAK